MDRDYSEQNAEATNGIDYEPASILRRLEMLRKPDEEDAAFCRRAYLSRSKLKRLQAGKDTRFNLSQAFAIGLALDNADPMWFLFGLSEPGQDRERPCFLDQDSIMSVKRELLFYLLRSVPFSKEEKRALLGYFDGAKATQHKGHHTLQ